METLATRILRDGPLNELDAVGWAIRLAKRIEALHALGVAHGAISPECVLTAAVDRTSKAILADLRQTPSRIAYQSPERIAGGTLSPGDDVWAIAATLYEVLTGTSAFGGGSDAETRQRIANTSPSPLAVFDVGDDDLQRILDDAFLRDRSARTTNAAAFRRALEEWHPDPAVRTLLPLDDEDSTNDEDDDEVRTLMRVSPLSSSQLTEILAQRALLEQSAGQPPPAPPERQRPPAAYPGGSPPRPGAAPGGAPGTRAAAAAPAAAGPVSRGRAPAPRWAPGVGAVPLAQSVSLEHDAEDDGLTIMRETSALGLPGGNTPVTSSRAGGTASIAHRLGQVGRAGFPGASAGSPAAGPPEPYAAGAPAAPFSGPERPPRPPTEREPLTGQHLQAGAARGLVDPDEAFLDEPTLDAPTLVDDVDDDDEDDVPTRSREAPSATPAPPQPLAALQAPPPLAAAAAPSRSAAAPLERGAGAPAAPTPGSLDAVAGGSSSPIGAAASAPSPPQQASPPPKSALAAQASAAPARGPTPGSAAPVSPPFGRSDGGGFVSEVPPPDRPGRLGVIIAVTVALLLAGGAMLFAARLGLLGAAPAVPGKGAPAAVAPPEVAAIAARVLPGRLLVEALDLGVEPAHVHALQQLGPEA
ncbi:uncharacterized protein SOCE26_072020 [Sorangium cellulosum]|uniref:Protein kinase domain-containing protein n=1 Tax=Sorangium cellulosum TaxID=56 RepID=A0A2L0F2D1_SORCE|nr:uncharacterized protein SOCE26_072020 [Sorangium cellulosum]